jgi:hypothetical protein
VVAKSNIGRIQERLGVVKSHRLSDVAPGNRTMCVACSKLLVVQQSVQNLMRDWMFNHVSVSLVNFIGYFTWFSSNNGECHAPAQYIPY